MCNERVLCEDVWVMLEYVSECYERVLCYDRVCQGVMRGCYERVLCYDRVCQGVMRGRNTRGCDEKI